MFGKEFILDLRITQMLAELNQKVKIDFRLASDYDQFLVELIRITESLFKNPRQAFQARSVVLKALLDVDTQKPNSNI